MNTRPDFDRIAAPPVRWWAATATGAAGIVWAACTRSDVASIVGMSGLWAGLCLLVQRRRSRTWRTSNEWLQAVHDATRIFDALDQFGPPAAPVARTETASVTNDLRTVADHVRFTRHTGSGRRARAASDAACALANKARAVESALAVARHATPAGRPLADTCVLTNPTQELFGFSEHVKQAARHVRRTQRGAS